MFESFNINKKHLIYRALLHAVRSNTGRGFLNRDQGHLAYISGTTPRDTPMDYTTAGDHPDHNELYKMMRELSDSLKDDPEFKKSDLILSWHDFCTIAVNAHQESVKIKP
jgi:hypothetical protein